MTSLGSLSATPSAQASLKGIGMLLLALTCFCLLDTTAKYLGKFYPGPMVVWARYLTAVGLMLLFLMPSKGVKVFRTKRLKIQLFRGLALATSSIFFFTGLTILPIAEAASIASVAPIMLTLLGVRYLKELPPKGTAIALAVSFLGVLVIVRPGGGLFTWAALLPMGSAIAYAVYQLLTRMVANDDDTYTSWVVSAVTAFVLLSVLVPMFWAPITDLWHLSLFLATGLFGSLGHLFIIKAYQQANTSTLAPFIYLQIAFALVAGYVVFGDFPDLLSFVGMLLIVGTGVTLAIMRRREANQSSKQEGGLYDD